MHTTPAYPYAEAQVPPYGSFIEGFDVSASDPMATALSLEGLSAFTIEGWIRPTQVDGGQVEGRDEVVIAGHATQASPGAPVHGAYLGINGNGKLVGVIDLAGGGRTEVESFQPLKENHWFYVALVFDGQELKLYQAECADNMLEEAPYTSDTQFAPTECGCLDQPVGSALSGGASVDTLITDFRVGARSEAPGNMTGCFSGRIDRLRVWAEALDVVKLDEMMREGGTSCGSPKVFDPVAHPSLLLFLDFEEPYLKDPFVTGNFGRYALDSSLYQRHGTVVNHGNPGASGRPLGDIEVDDPANPGTPLVFRAGRSLRLNHEQVHDAQFDEVTVQIELDDVLDLSTLPGLNPSGLYVLQAIFEEDGQYDWDSPTNLRREHFTSFVVRPDEITQPESLPTRAAVIVPINTYMAYNPWPRVAMKDWNPSNQPTPTAIITAPGLDLRYSPAGEVRAQGANSAYQGFGTKEQNWYPSWLRPCAATSPRVPFPDGTEHVPMRNEFSCTSDAKLIGWLGDPSGTGDVTVNTYEFDVFTDADIHRNPCLLDPYGAVLLGAHPEYFSLAMLVGLHKYMDDPDMDNSSGGLGGETGNLLTVGGNSIAWRSEAKDVGASYVDWQADPPEVHELSNYVIEIKKWPEVASIGEYDGLSHMYPKDLTPNQTLEPNGRTGAWRFVEQFFPKGNPQYDFISDSPALAPPTPFHPGGFELGSTRDYILGTVVDSGGVSGNSNLVPGESCPPGPDTEKHGYWKMADTSDDVNGPHWLLDGLVPNTDLPSDAPASQVVDPLQWVKAGRAVGNESDRFVCHQDIARTLYMEEWFAATYTLNEFCMTGLPQLYPQAHGQPLRQYCPPALYMTGQNAFHAAPPTSLPVIFPYSDNGQVDILATGSGFNERCKYSMVLWCSPMFDTVSADWAMWASGYGMAPICYSWLHLSSVMEGHGNIVYYRHRNGGRVLTLAAIDAVSGLVVPVPPQGAGLGEDNSQVRDMVKLALDRMLLGVGGEATTRPVHSTTRPPLDGFNPTLSPPDFPLYFPVPENFLPVFESWEDLCGGL
ncbi:MAG: N,N-dimethylformamidase beta subunit family domain-containing protein [Planctomycetota bacterium]